MTTLAEFAHPELLADPEWLEKHRHDPDLVVVDLDSASGYSRGHIPGAVHLEHDYERNPESGWVDTLPPGRFARVCQGLGIGDSTQVVAYDNNRSLYAARFWWVLSYYGHRQVKVLNGGWRGWVTGGHPVSFVPSPSQGETTFTPQVQPALKADLEEVKTACSMDNTIIWDTRSYPEFSGQQDRGHRRRGHIAGAVHLDWLDLMDPETHRFKPATELHRLLSRQGFSPDKAVYAY